MEQQDKNFETVLLARGGNEGNQENIWYLDTGASNHMCGKKRIFQGREIVEGFFFS